MSVTCVEEDRISNLPEHLIDSILEWVPLEDAVRTSIISKKWRYKWTTMKALFFDYQFFKRYEKNGVFGGYEFIKIIKQVSLLYKGPISIFHLFIPKMNLDSFQEVDEWILFLSRNSVKELTISNKNEHYELPSHVFSCLELEKLHLGKCFFKPPLDFKGFLNLEDLYLYQIDFGVNQPGTTQMSLPQLKKLTILNCTNVNNFNIKATKLQKLSVMSCPDAMLSRLLDSPCLTVLGIIYLNSVQDERMNLARMLSKLPRIEHLYISGDFYKCFIAETIPKWLPHAVNSLKMVYVVDFEIGDLDEVHGVFCLLRNSPNLERLDLFFMMQVHMVPRVVNGEAEALSHLEAPNCLGCTLNELKTVEIRSLKGSKLELLFIKILLAHSPSLDKFTIQPNGITDAQKRVDVGNDVMKFPRASPKAEGSPPLHKPKPKSSPLHDYLIENTSSMEQVFLFTSRGDALTALTLFSKKFHGIKEAEEGPQYYEAGRYEDRGRINSHVKEGLIKTILVEPEFCKTKLRFNKDGFN